MKKFYWLVGLSALLWPSIAVSQIGLTITDPILSVSPQKGEFGGVQTGSEAKMGFTITNTGTSVLKIKAVDITGAGFTLSDPNEYPFEVNSDTGYAFSEGNNGAFLKFSVSFNPEVSGITTGMVTIIYGLYGDKSYNIPLSGEGLSCMEATIARIGENWAPKKDSWFRYTADKFSIVEVTSCNPHQQRTKNEPPWNIFLYMYYDCLGSRTPVCDECPVNCPYDPDAAQEFIVMDAGETIYLFWPRAFPDSAQANDGFYFNINVTYPTEGDVCENAIPLTLPVVNHFGTTLGFNDDYDFSPCTPISGYMDGNDKVYTITLPGEGYLTGSILGAYASVHILDTCPKEELEKSHCKAFAGGVNGGQFHRKTEAGTYFVIISNWSPPNSVDYLLNMSWEDLSSVDNADLITTVEVFPNPTQDKFFVSIRNPAATEGFLELISHSGQTVYRTPVKTEFSSTVEIEISQFAKGIYYLKAIVGERSIIKKIAIE